MKYNRIILSIVLNFLLTATVFAQKATSIDHPEDLTFRSEIKYLFKIPEDSVYDYFYLARAPHPKADWMQRANYSRPAPKLDSFLRSDSLPSGHYLIASAEAGYVQTTVFHKTRATSQVPTVDMKSYWLLLLQDNNGKDIEDAVVKMGRNIIAFDRTMKGYKINVDANHVVEIRKGAEQKFLQIYRNTNYAGNNYRNNYYSNYYGYKGYLVTNQPVYKPGDTLRYKAYLLDSKTNKPIRDTLKLSVNGNRRIDIHTITPKAPGVYFDEFVIGDSIPPDRTYQLYLSNHDANKSIQQSFKVVDYLLDDIYLNVKTEGLPLYQSGDSVHLYVFAHNANGLPLTDGNLEIVVTARNPYFKKGGQSAFLPDTIWQQIMPSNPDGDTHIGFLPNIIPEVQSMDLQVHLRLRNANFAQKDTSFVLPYSSKSSYLKFEEKGNLLNVSLIKNKQSVSGKGTFQKGNDTTKTYITFPYTTTFTEKDSRFIFKQLNDTGAEMAFDVYNFKQNALFIEDSYVKDTAIFWVKNAKKTPIRYIIYEGNDAVREGLIVNDSLIKIRTKNDATVTMVYSYQDVGTMRSGTAIAFKMNTKMNIGLNKKDIIYPGQKDNITVRLSNNDDKGIANTNLTVLAFNANFAEDFVPRLSANGIIKPGLKTPEFNITLNPLHANNNIRNYPIDKVWAEKLELDKIFFYKDVYLSEKSHEIIQLKLKDNSPAQMAVYIKNGPVYTVPNVVYVDNDPVYVSATTLSTNPNALAVSAGTKRLQVRVANALYHFPQTQFKQGYKTIIFINPERMDTAQNKSNYYASKQIMPDTLTPWEQSAIFNNTIQINDEVGANFMVKNGDNLYQYTSRYNNYYGYGDYDYYDRGQYSRTNIVSIAPISFRSKVEFYQQGHVKTNFMPEQNYQYAVRPGVLRMKEVPATTVINKRIVQHSIVPNFAQTLAPTIDFDTLEVYPTVVAAARNRTKNTFLHVEKMKAHKVAPARIQVMTSSSKYIKSIIAIPHQNTDSPIVSNYAQNTPVTLYTEPGVIDLYCWWSDTAFSVIKNVSVKTGGSNIVYISEQEIWSEMPKSMAQYFKINYTVSKSEAGYTTRFDTAAKQYLIRGVVVDSFGTALSKVTIEIEDGSIKKTITTDKRGYFAFDKTSTNPQTLSLKSKGYKDFVIAIPDNATKQGIDFSIVMEQKESIAQETIYENLYEILTSEALKLTRATKKYAQHFKDQNPALANELGIATTDDDKLLEGVTVYGQKIDRRSYTGAINTVSSAEIERRPSTSISGQGMPGQPNAAPPMQMRGMASMSAAPSVEIIDPITAETSGNVLESGAGQAFVEDFLSNMQAASGMRNNFRDWAIWEPNLWTDDNGDASFSVQYPDNTTAWKTYVLAMNPDGYAATQFSMTKAFKPLSASLSLPRFLRYGDAVEAIGKVVNHTGQPFTIKTNFSSWDTDTTSDFETIQNGKLEKHILAVPQSNSAAETEMSSSFSLQTEAEYEDGEKHTLPVLPVGVVERKGMFTTLSNDTIIHSKASDFDLPFTGTAYVTIEGSLLEVMLSEIENLKVYPHGCTEQMTSKLLSIHYEEKVKKALGSSDFNNKAPKAELLKKIVKAQNADGSFGWFSGNSVDFRITNYVLSTLQKTAEASFQPILYKGLSFLNHNLSRAPQADRIAALSILSAAKYSSNYAKELEQLDTKTMSEYDQFAIIKISKEQGLPYHSTLDSLIKKADSSSSGMLWGAKSYDWYRNELATTALVYEIIKNDTVYASRTPAILRYLLSKRKNGYYSNTAESGLILSTLLPDMLSKNEAKYKEKIITRVILSGSAKDTITSFPKQIKIQDKDAHFTVQKQGISPVYFSVNYEYFNTAPKTHDGSFKVRSEFLGQKDQSQLQQGAQVTMRVSVEVTQNSEYVLIDVPIPAGCVIVGKGSNNRHESSRANFKDKTSIYCGYLPKGTHHFDITMQARYKGQFSINPASASLMYFADEYGHNEIKKMEIK